MKKNKRLTKFVECCYQIRRDKRINVSSEDAKRIELSHMMTTDLHRSHSGNKRKTVSLLLLTSRIYSNDFFHKKAED